MIYRAISLLFLLITGIGCSTQLNVNGPIGINEVKGLRAITGKNHIRLQWAAPDNESFAGVKITWTPKDGENQPILVDKDITNRIITN